MKKFTKVCLIIAAVLGAIGLSLCLTGVILGVNSEDFEKASLSWDLHGKSIVWSGKDRRNVEEVFERVDKLELDVEAGDVTIEEADVEQIVVKGTRVYASFECRMEGSTLKVEDKNKRYINLGNFHIGNESPQITIQIPKGKEFREMDLDIGAGELQVYGFRTGKLEMNCGAGSAELEGYVSGECDLETGMGELKFTGKLEGKTSVDCGMGSTTLNLENKQNDFNYDLECGMGEINVGDNSIGGMGGEQKIEMGAAKTMTIDCGMGSVDVYFEN